MLVLNFSTGENAGRQKQGGEWGKDDVIEAEVRREMKKKKRDVRLWEEDSVLFCCRRAVTVSSFNGWDSTSVAHQSLSPVTTGKR